MPDGSFSFRAARDRLLTGNAFQASPPLAPKGRVGTWTSGIHYRGTKNGAAIASGNPVEADPWLRAAGCSVQYSGAAGAEQVEYRPKSSALESTSEWFYQDGKLYKLLGAKAELTISFEAGGPLVVEAQRTGLYQAPVDAAMPASPSFGTATAPVFENVSFQIDGFSAGVIRRFSFTTGNAVALRPSAGAAGALAPHKIRSRKVTWECVLEDPLLATKDFEALEASNAPVLISWSQTSSAQYSRLSFLAPNARIEGISKGDDSGTSVMTISGGAYDNGANDAFSLTAT